MYFNRLTGKCQLKYILYPVHVSDLQRLDWAEQRNSVLESAVDVYKRNKALPIS